MLDVDSPELFRALAEQAASRLRSFKLDELLFLAWGTCNSGLHSGFSDAVLDEVVLRLGQSDPSSWPEVTCRKAGSAAQIILGILSACCFAGLLREDLLAAARDALRQTGRTLDNAAAAGMKAVRGLPETAKGRSNRLQEESLKASCLDSEPRVVLDLPDRLVVLKPPDWEVSDQHVERQLLLFLKLFSSEKWPILADFEHRRLAR